MPSRLKLLPYVHQVSIPISSISLYAFALSLCLSRTALVRAAMPRRSKQHQYVTYCATLSTLCSTSTANYYYIVVASLFQLGSGADGTTATSRRTSHFYHALVMEATLPGLCLLGTQYYQRYLLDLKHLLYLQD